MNAFNGFVVGLVGLLAIVAGVFILLVGTETISVADVPGEAFDQQLAVMASKTGASWWADMGIAIGLIVSGVVLLTLEFMNVTRAATPEMVLLSSDAEGAVRVSLESIRELAEQTGRGNRDVRRIRCVIRVTAGGLRIRCTVGLRMAADLPGASAKIQKDVREVIERLVGLPVLEVLVRARYVRDRDQAVLVR